VVSTDVSETKPKRFQSFPNIDEQETRHR